MNNLLLKYKDLDLYKHDLILGYVFSFYFVLLANNKACELCVNKDAWKLGITAGTKSL